MPFQGSPPRVRGKENHTQALQPQPRITPARAGKSGTQCAERDAYADHPRACGEKLDNLYTFLTEIGSPPRVRGKVMRYGFSACKNRITPARAGKSFRKKNNARRGTDHPRACGEKQYNGATTSHVTGSPPRVRGKVSSVNVKVCRNRITPARAGKSKAGATVGHRY